MGLAYRGESMGTFSLSAMEILMKPKREPPSPRTKGRVLRAQD